MKDTLGVLASGRRRRAALSAHPRPRQARRHLRRHLPHYRRHAVQLHQLQPAQRLYPHPVQGALAQSPHPRGLADRRQRTRRVRRNPSAHEARQRGLVQGNRRCRLPEHLFHRQRALQVRPHPLRRPHLQDELRAHARAAQAVRRRRHHRHHPHRPQRVAQLRRGRTRPRWPRHRIPGKAQEPPTCVRPTTRR